MRYALLFVMVLHGLIHLMGFAKAFGYAELNQLKQPIPAPVGLLWLLACVGLLTAGGLYFAKSDAWPWVAMAAAAISQLLIVMTWSDAKFGTVANLILVVPALMAALETRASAFHNRYDATARESLRGQGESAVLRDEELSHLPEIVQRYIRTSGAVGRPKVRSFRMRLAGQMKNGLDAPFMAFRSEQVNSVDPAVRAFLMRASQYGVPMEALHLFRNGKATMEVKVASAIEVVSASGAEMDRGETVTFFNDLCLFAPGALTELQRVRWEAEGPLSVRATFQLAGPPIQARLQFNEKFELVNFISEDRFMSADGKTYQRLPWSTPVREYREIDGLRVPGRAEAVWHTRDGNFSYGTFNLVDIEYNPRSVR